MKSTEQEIVLKASTEGQAIRFNPSYSAQGIIVSSGPCTVCGLTNYPLSMGGPQICPACDCGILPTDSRHPKAQLDSAVRGMVKAGMQTESEAIVESFAQWMQQHNLSTGNGDSMPALLKELHWQFEQIRLDRAHLVEILGVIVELAAKQSGVRWDTVSQLATKALESVNRPHPNWTPSLAKRPESDFSDRPTSPTKGPGPLARSLANDLVQTQTMKPKPYTPEDSPSTPV